MAASVVSPELLPLAKQFVQHMKAAGFDQAQAVVADNLLDEVNIEHNQASLMRSTVQRKASLVGVIQGRKASTECSDLSPAGMDNTIAQLKSAAMGAPADQANQLSVGQMHQYQSGPQTSSVAALVDHAKDLLVFRNEQTPKVVISGATAFYQKQQLCLVNSGDSHIEASVGAYGGSVFANAVEGTASSSFDFVSGHAASLGAAQNQSASLFGADAMLRSLEQQIKTQKLAAAFTGQAIFTPAAVADILGWLIRQISDAALISGASVFKDKTGQPVASELLTIRSRYDGPAVMPVSEDGFACPATTVVSQGVLSCLLASLYGSKKLGLPHTPTPFNPAMYGPPQGYEILPGKSSLQSMINQCKAGVFVARLSMGAPGIDGEFSGVVKNSFVIENGQLGTALAETMIAGNMLRVLTNITAISQERIDLGGLLLPWMTVGDMQFS
jgi:PmbA protein